MEKENQRIIAVWAVFVLSFLGFGAFLYTLNQLTAEFVVIYWSPIVLMTIFGVFSPPWEPFTG